MGRGPKPAKGRAKPAGARQSPKNDAARVRDLEKCLAEALEREKATGEILRVIGISSTDIQPVFATVAETAARLPSSVSRAGFYAWHGRARDQVDERLRIDIAAIHVPTRQRYGSPRIHAELVARGCRTGRKRVARLMRVHGLAARCRRRFRVTTQSRHPFPIASNVLARRFERPGPDQAWVTDITYIPTGEGWLYLAVILDLYSRFAVGWAMHDRITDDLTLDALGMVLARRRPSPPGCFFIPIPGVLNEDGARHRRIARSRQRRG